MHAVKVSWVGQTFALAQCSDSRGKKSRIRRTKEERKTMVEFFIMKYQNSNNGDFPSLNLTHKEVGGSFYAVREIFRELIQENRVLGPAKLSSKEKNNDQFSEEYPLGSISREPQSQLSLSSNETLFVPNDHQSISKELVSISSSQFTVHQQQRFNNSRCINGNLVNEEYKEADASKSSEQGQIGAPVDDETLFTDLQNTQKLEGVKNIVEASISKVTPIATYVTVETFPLPAAKLTRSMVGRSEEVTDLTGTLGEQETGKGEVTSAPGNTGSLLDRMDSSEKDFSGSVDKKAAANCAYPLLESLSSFVTGESVMSSLLEGTDLQVDESYNDVLTLQACDPNQVVAGIEPKLAANDSHTKNFHADNTSSACGESISQETLVVENEADVQRSCITEGGKNSSLNRINLESWEGASKKPAEANNSPVWAVFKAFLTAFAKFWSE